MEQNKPFNGEAFTRTHNHATLSTNPRDALAFASERAVTQLFKEFLGLLEKSYDRHIESLNKIHDALPNQYQPYVSLADWFTEDEAERLRKEVLRRGNDTIRIIREEMDKYSVDFRRG